MEKIFVPSDRSAHRPYFHCGRNPQHLQGAAAKGTCRFSAPAQPDAELEAIKGLGLVAPVDPSVPAEVLQGATEEAALRCVLESFTAEESHELVEYLEKRYADQIEKSRSARSTCPCPLASRRWLALAKARPRALSALTRCATTRCPFRLRVFTIWPAKSRLTANSCTQAPKAATETAHCFQPFQALRTRAQRLFAFAGQGALKLA